MANCASAWPRTGFSVGRYRLYLSCEHGGHDVPRPYRGLFAGAGDVLKSHRGWDPGALPLAREMAQKLDGPLHFATVSRLLVDLNRSPGHRAQFSTYSRGLSRAAREEVCAAWYWPYRQQVEEEIGALVSKGESVLHLSIHSFTPIWDGVRRHGDVGLLYDPGRRLELAWCVGWQAALAEAAPGLLVRRNYPYRGVSDGFTRYLRGRFPAEAYLGIEVEINQRFPLGPAGEWRQLRALLCDTLGGALEIE